ncbi:MAG: tRNA delta(2)-isopentenylpyrophosphate transferase [uncultured bacterium]|nr:MAG: tRNA delta(2)-isopentenylpyrophosphate transferase [uncultured bacterium]
MKNNLPKVVFIVGPTASGKTELSVFLAKNFNGEIVNADSRQVYKEMEIATAKPPRDNSIKNNDHYISNGITHHVMDCVKPSENFTLSDYRARAQVAITDILERGKLPIVVGGTGLYVWTLIDNLDIPKVAPNQKLRKSFEDKSLDELVKLLANIDSESIDKIDIKNKRRVLRALEVSISTGESFSKQTTKSEPTYNCLQIGTRCERPELYRRIEDRIEKQLDEGLLEETKKLSKKYPFTLPSMSSIGYKQMGYYLREEMTYVEAVKLFKRDTKHYAKRQLSWFNRDKRIIWVDNKDFKTANKLVGKFLSK